MTADEFETICLRIEKGESLRSQLAEPGAPCLWTFYAFKDANPENTERYARARERQAAWFADEIIDVARGATNETWGRDRLLIDALKWSAGKQYPRIYGDRTTHTHEGNVDLDVRIVAARKRAGGDEG